MNRPPRAALGMSLVEVLVAVLILSFGLIGLGALQARAIRGKVSALQRNQAILLSQYILDLIRVDAAEARRGSYNAPAGGSDFSCNPADFSGPGLQQANLNAWLSALKSQVGRKGDTTTCGRVRCATDGLCEIQIRWDDRSAGGLDGQTLTVRSRL